MKHKIIVKNAVKRKSGFIYHIDTEGNLIEERRQGLELATVAATPGRANEMSFTEDKETIGPITSAIKLSDNDIKSLGHGIRNQSFRRLIEIYYVPPGAYIGPEDLMKKYKISRRTAYDYINTLKALKKG